MSFSAKVIADSINWHEDRLTSFVITLPRIVLAELNTHRALSRNSASSRAIPFEKMVERCYSNPFSPLAFQKAHSGMQGSEEFNAVETVALRHEWDLARNKAVIAARKLDEKGVTKQICNRLLEPFMWHTVIITGSEPGWHNFFALRAHEAAEIHIQQAAFMMLSEYNASKPKQIEIGHWHIPFGDQFDETRLELLVEKINDQEQEQPRGPYTIDDAKVWIATARCARVSYLNYEGSDDYLKDIQLHDRLSEMGHWSPFEHCAMSSRDVHSNGNFGHGWSQYRKRFPTEMKRDPRIISHR